MVLVKVSKQCNSINTKAAYCADKMRLPTTCHTARRIQNTNVTHIYLGHGHQDSSSSHTVESTTQLISDILNSTHWRFVNVAYFLCISIQNAVINTVPTI